MQNRLVRSKSCLEQVLKDMLVEEHNRNYLAAQNLKNQANKLKADIAIFEKKGDKRKHKKELEEVNSMQAEELRNWKHAWELEINEFKAKEEELENELKAKHEEELREIKKEFQEEFRDYRESGAIIELKRKEDIFSRQTQYLEAHYVLTERMKLEQQEREAFEKLKAAKLKTLLKKTKLRQET